MRLYLRHLLLLFFGGAASVSGFVLLPYGERQYGWEISAWISTWRHVIAWVGVAMVVYALLALRLLLLTSHEKRNRRR